MSSYFCVIRYLVKAEETTQAGTEEKLKLLTSLLTSPQENQKIEEEFPQNLIFTRKLCHPKNQNLKKIYSS